MQRGIRVLVTGGAGYVGSHVVKLLGERGFEVLVYDNLLMGHKEAVLYGRLVEGELGDKGALRQVFEEFKPDVVMHFASFIVVPESVREPLKYYRNNVVNTVNLLEVMEEFKVNRFIFSSSASVYGIPKKVPIDEGEPLKPINPYGETKATVESILRDLASSNDKFKYVSLRYFNVAGAEPKAQIGEAHKVETHLIPLILRAIKNGGQFYIYGTDYPTPDGTCIRDFIYVMDLAEAHLLALEYLLDGGRSEVFNCGYGYGFSVLEVIQTAKKVTGRDFKVVEGRRREGDTPVLVASNKKIKRILNWRPKYEDLEFIIKTAWEWEKKRRY